MRSLINHLFSENGEFTVSTELVLVATIAVLSMIVGIGNVSSNLHRPSKNVGATSPIVPRPYDFSRLCSHDGSCDRPDVSIEA